MLWLCLLVVVLSVVYVVLIGRKYTDFVQTAQPYIEEGIDRNEKLTDAIQAEKEILRKAIEDIKDVELLVGDLKIGVMGKVRRIFFSSLIFQ